MMTLTSCLPRMVLAACLCTTPAFAQPASPPTFETPARQAMIVEKTTGAILFQKAPDAPFPPASLAKLMTMEIVFDALAKGELTLDTTFRVSENAWRIGGAPSRTSTMFAAVRSEVPVSALVQGVIVQAANDAAIILAEGMAGTEESFAARMNERAGALGLTGSRFVNATGLPAEGQVVTVRDLPRLARHIETTYPDLYRTYAQGEFEWNGILQRNRNPLLPLEVGATGMATGYTEAAGYSLVGVASDAQTTTFLALGGLASAEERALEARRLLVWSRESFDRRTLFATGDVVALAQVFGGTAPNVRLVVGEELVAFTPKDRPGSVKASVVYEGPLDAPVAKGQAVGRIDVLVDGEVSVSHTLLAADDVSVGTFAARAFGAVQELAFGWIRAL